MSTDAGIIDDAAPLSAPDLGREELLRATPPELAGVFPTFDWDVQRLWQLDLPPEDFPIEQLDWLLQLPIWRWSGRRFVLTPAQVLADPNSYWAHHNKAMAADLQFPIHITFRNSRWVILDGYHRLLKALIVGDRTIRAVKVEAGDLA